MHQILIIAGIIGILLFLRWIRKQPRKKQIQALLVLAAVILIGLALAGRLHWLFAIGAAAAAVFQKVFGLLRFAPLFKNLFTNIPASNSTTDSTTDNKETTNSINTIRTKEEAYKILGIDKNANKDEIIAAHRNLIQKIHPDRGGNDYLAAKINQAKDYLLKEDS